MKVGILTREYPPDVYGGAGVHVDFLVRRLRSLMDVDVHCWGDDRPGAHGHRSHDPALEDHQALRTLAIDLSMSAAVGDCDVVHSHTWYANLGGHVAKLLYGIPHVLTTHSLEPDRPWKVEQLGGGYRVSSWAERTALLGADAVIAVSEGMRRDVLRVYPETDPERIHVVRNGIDTDLYRSDPRTDALVAHGIDPDRPYVLFVGRVTRQKGVPHLLRAARHLRAGAQLVLGAGEADTPELDAEFKTLVAELERARNGVIWIPEMLPRTEIVQLLTHAAAFVCPSVYEPLGIVNLEAMACGAPVVASAVGGIPEVVVDGETGSLVAYEENDPEAFESGLAEGINALLDDPDRARAMGQAGRERARSEFGWDRIAEQTLQVYRHVIGESASAV